MRRSKLLSLMFGLALAAAPTARAQSQSPPCSAAEYHKFDFWVGDWDVKTPDGKPTLDRITWTPKGDEVHQVWDQSSDAGKTWTTVFHGIYRRKAAAK